MKSLRRILCCLIFVSLTMVFARDLSQARADDITYSFSGTIESNSMSGTATGIGSFSITYGEAFTGTISYDPSSAPDYTSATENLFDDPTARISVTIGSLTLGETFLNTFGSAGSNQTVFNNYQETNNNQLEYYNSFEASRGSGSSSNNVVSSVSIVTNYSNTTTTPQNYFPGGTMPTDLSLANLPSATIQISDTINNYSTNMYTTTFGMYGIITNLSLVPEPSSLILFGLAIPMAGVYVRFRRRRSAAF